MNNIFENAYFGKVYKMRDGRKAIYMWCDREYLYPHSLITEGERLKSDYLDSGKSNTFKSYDIVSEWKEPINEEELDELAKQEYPLKTKYGFSALDGFPVKITEYREKEITAFKNGYCKGWREKQRQKKK